MNLTRIRVGIRDVKTWSSKWARIQETVCVNFRKLFWEALKPKRPRHSLAVEGVVRQKQRLGMLMR